MAKAIEQLRNGLVVGHALLGRRGPAAGTVEQEVHDGDTVNVAADGDFGVRFLGVDAPEVSVPLPGTELPFVPLSDPQWSAALADPFADGATPFDVAVDPALVKHLASQVGPGEAANHARLGAAARAALVAMVTDDLTALGTTVDTARFFLAFAGDVMDRYGRLLGYLQPDQPNTAAAERRGSYNERLLTAGWVSPYFIWPNTNPFRKADSVIDAVPAPGTAAELAQSDDSLRRARRSVRQARDQQIGLYEAANPLRLLPFELRILSRRRPPDRWVVDLSSDSDVLVAPQSYPVVANPEDRLYVPAEFVPLWVERGWKRP